MLEPLSSAPVARLIKLIALFIGSLRLGDFDGTHTCHESLSSHKSLDRLGFGNQCKDFWSLLVIRGQTMTRLGGEVGVFVEDD